MEARRKESNVDTPIQVYGHLKMHKTQYTWRALRLSSIQKTFKLSQAEVNATPRILSLVSRKPLGNQNISSLPIRSSANSWGSASRNFVPTFETHDS